MQAEERETTGRRKRSVDQELELASKVQYHLLPERVPTSPGYEFDAYYSPAGEIGGDYYDFIQHDDDIVEIAVGDAIDKGISAALLMVETRVLLRAFAHQSSSPAEILRKVNAVLHKDLRRGMFVSLYYVRMDLKKRIVTAASAGHTPMLVCKTKSHRCFPIRPEGPALGAMGPKAFDKAVKQVRFKLVEGDRFLLFTDGANEAMDEEGNPFGVERLAESLMHSADQSSSSCLRHMIRSIRDHRGTAPPSDDITLVTCRLTSEKDIKK